MKTYPLHVPPMSKHVQLVSICPPDNPTPLLKRTIETKLINYRKIEATLNPSVVNRATDRKREHQKLSQGALVPRGDGSTPTRSLLRMSIISCEGLLSR